MMRVVRERPRRRTFDAVPVAVHSPGDHLCARNEYARTLIFILYTFVLYYIFRATATFLTTAPPLSFFVYLTEFQKLIR